MDAGQVALAATVLTPAGVGAVLILLGKHGERLATPISVATAALACGLSVLAAVTQPSVAMPFMADTDLALGVDSLSALVLPTVTAVTLLILVFSAANVTESRPRFHGLMLMFAASATVTVTAETLPTLLIGWEIMGATSYALIGFRWREPQRVSGGLTAFVTTRSADLGLYVASAAALAGGAGLTLTDLPDASPGWREVIAAGVLVAALGKAAQLPFSFWLSRAMEGPSPVSALLHSAAMVAMGGYLLLRTSPLLASTGWAGPAAAWVGASTAVLLGMVAVAQTDLKQLLAASTAAQLGFVVLGAGLGAVSGGAAQLIAHATTKAVLFLAAGAWLSALGTKHLDGLGGVARRWPVVGVAATIGALSLAGVAPLSLWATKDAVLAAALEESPWLYAVGLLGAALSAAYAGKILIVIWARPLREPVQTHLDEEEPGTRTIGALEVAPLLVLAAGATVLGVLAPRAPIVELVVSAVLAVTVLLASMYWWSRARLPAPGWTQQWQWLGLEAAAHALLVRPTLRLAGALATFDDRVLDAAVQNTASGTMRAARWAARRDDRDVDGVVNAVAVATRALGRVARRPQSGQLHDYYLQAAVVIAVGVVLLVVTSRW